MHFVTLIHHDGSGYGFTIPDIPGFTAHAEKCGLETAITVARRVLADHLAALVDAGLALPEARPPEEVFGDPAFREEIDEAVSTMLLPALLPAGRTLRVNVSIDEATLALADRAADDRGLTRSAFIAEACRRFAAGEGLAGVAERYRQHSSVGSSFPSRVQAQLDALAESIAEATGTGRHLGGKPGRAKL